MHEATELGTLNTRLRAFPDIEMASSQSFASNDSWGAEDQAETRFRALADNMAPLAWVADPGGVVRWLNKQWFAYTGRAESDTDWLGAVHVEHVERVRSRLAENFTAGESMEDTFPLRAADGSYGWFLCRVVPVRAADSIGMWCATCTDITEQRNLGARLRQKARLIDLSHEAIFAWDLERGIVFWNKGCEELFGFEKAEALGASSRELLKTRPLGSDAAAAVLRDGRWSGALVRDNKDGHAVFVDSRQELMRVDGRDIILETNRDIGERIRAERTREILTGEIHHRVNNVLAIVQSIAAQTARSATSMAEFTTRFNARLMALASTHSTLGNSDWAAANLRELISAQITTTLGDVAGFEIDGPDAMLPAQTAIQLGLVLCELASNARSHGALSRKGGRVSIKWRVEGQNPDQTLHIDWVETGGPPVEPPQRQRFGLSMIERARNLPFLKLDVEFARAGLICRMRATQPDQKQDFYFVGIGRGAGSAK